MDPLVDKHSHRARARNQRQRKNKADNDLESRHLKATNEVVCAAQEALTTTSMISRQGNDNYIDEPARLRHLLTETEDPISDRHFTDTVLQGLAEECRDIRIMVWNDPEFDLPQIQSVLRHLYLYGLSRSKPGTMAGRGKVVTAQYQQLTPKALHVANAARKVTTRTAVPYRAGFADKARRPLDTARRLDQGVALGSRERCTLGWTPNAQRHLLLCTRSSKLTDK